MPSSGLTGSRACPSTLFSPAHGLDDLLTFSVLALCRRTWAYMVEKVQSWSSSPQNPQHGLLANLSGLIFLLRALETNNSNDPTLTGCLGRSNRQ